MKEFLEEYGGIITACILSLILLGTMADLGRAVGEEIRAVLVVTEAGFAAKLQQLAQTAENAE